MPKFLKIFQQGDGPESFDAEFRQGNGTSLMLRVVVLLDDLKTSAEATPGTQTETVAETPTEVVVVLDSL